MTRGIYLEFRQLIEINQKMIDEAIAANSSSCMIAEAIAAHFPNAEKIHVDIQTIRFTIDTKRFIFLTSKAIQTHIQLWDIGIKPEPFSFKLNNPSQVINSKKGMKRTIKATTIQNKNGAIVKIDGRSPPTLGGNQRVFGMRGFHLPDEAADRLIANIQAAKRKSPTV